ncbi:MAG: hypothetical protein IAE77_22400 [Prosthecobacter sp.]|uniref:hypothetical protein n=1 Tax=Prosthecobacter sp. TaxID=1965333 RepID=UPI001A027A9A|nr:hypothetical protein [Prosthecobacter sp.]MBE2286223.1 hypothetical protein [Prosthecobacter sp.]
MKNFLRKLKLSFLAMLCGWVACNIAWWVGLITNLDVMTIQPSNLYQSFNLSIIVAICTAVVILHAWLLIFLPVDLCLSDGSKMRRPKMAALFGFLVAFSMVAAAYCKVAWSSGTFDRGTLPYIFGTCTTGTFAGYIRALLDQPKRHAP